MRLIVAGSIVLLGMACAGGSDHVTPSASIAVVWVAGESAPAPAAFQGTGDGELTPGMTVTLYGVAGPDDAQRLIRALEDRGDSIIAGLGRAMLPILGTAGPGWRARLWLGFDEPTGGFREDITAWWAPAESLRGEVARRATVDARAQVILVGSSLPAATLQMLRDSGKRVRPVATGPGTLPMGLVASPDDVVLMLEAVPVPDAVWERVYWACESPFEVPPKARVEMRMDWAGAIVAAAQWVLGTGGVAPGPHLGPWLTLETADGEG
ncbi:MAG: hypothetical protein MUE60_13515 [Candidatus Eisenbacteria bacterium]|nr:hypothetical protein [Candidatus Eisenbacteria bacterium]